MGLEMIRSGRADVVVAGGTEACIHPITIASFAAMRALSTRNDEPERASRPYDKARDGFVMGEGAGILVLESAEHAAARGARGLRRARRGRAVRRRPPHRAAGARGRGHHGRAIRQRARVAADVAPADIVHVNAHATSTPQGDVAEAAAIRAALGAAADGVACRRTKSMTGHLLGGAGAVESVAAILALRDRHGAAHREPRRPGRRRSSSTSSAAPPRALRGGDIAALNNSFGFGGHNVAWSFRSV